MTEVIVTKDGSHTLLNTQLNETYHSVHGAIQESKHVFIQEGLAFACARKGHATLQVLEIGFGTGLNALLAAQHMNAAAGTLRYTTLEAYPLEEAIWKKLNYADALNGQQIFEHLHACAWEEDVAIHPRFILHKQRASLLASVWPPAAYDVIFFDAFAPSKQPEMWTIDVLQNVTHALTAGGIFVTYCAKGQLKRDLKTLGLVVETLAGPPGKKEMIRAIKEK